MIISVLTLFVLAVTVTANPMHTVRQPKEIAQRRQIIGYSNDIVHENPNYPDQAGQSSVKVNFNSGPTESRKQIYTSSQYQHEYPQAYSQDFPTSAPQSQLFNVGYSVSFTNGNSKPSKPPVKYPRKNNLDDGEIITGTRKLNEEVQIPTINMSPQEYVSSAIINGINSKKQKISGIKQKPQLITSYQNPKVLLAQANLSPSTQKYYKTLEQLKPQIQNTQELKQKYSWTNLSPGVEIIRSTEVPVAPKYVRAEQSPHFDHARALGRSQEFDYTNAIDNNNAPQQNVLFYNIRKSQPQQVLVNQNNHKLPLDTTLLQDPVPVDTRLLEETIRNQMSLYNPKYVQPQEQPQNVNYAQQAYRTIPVEETTDTKALPVVYRPEQPQAFQEYATDQDRYQFKMYGKPQPVLFDYTDEQESFKRQPRFLGNLYTNLRPPPFDQSYQRRIRIG